MTDLLTRYLEPGPCVNSDHPRIIELARTLTRQDDSPTQAAISLYYYVRDRIRYNPYTAATSEASLRATATLEAGEGWCVPKAVLLAALARAVAIPARLGFADVRNHLSTERMRERMQTDLFYFHGYSSLWLEDKWVKATPAFNRSLCDKFGLLPLEFDGENDSLYHPFDQQGNRHMEYLHDRGEYAEVPVAELEATFRLHYPTMFPDLSGATADTQALEAGRWDKDVARETGAGAE